MTHVPVQSGTTVRVQSDVEVGCELGYMNSDDRMAKRHDDEESDEEDGKEGAERTVSREKEAVR